MLTLAIPFHSRPDLLRLALRSVENQTSRAWEVFVCDDSEDGEAGKVVAEFDHSRIRWIQSPRNQGITQNWNFAVEQVKSELYCLLHADDELEPRYVEKMLALTLQYPNAAAYYCRVTVIDGQGDPTFSFPDWIKTFIEGNEHEIKQWEGESAATQLLRGNFIFCPTVVYRRSRNLSKFDTRYSQVMDLQHLLTLLETQKIVGSPEALYRYRRHSHNLTAQNTRDLFRFHEEIALYREWAERFKEIGWKTAEKTARHRIIVRLHLVYRMVEDGVALRWNSIVKKARMLRL